MRSGGRGVTAGKLLHGKRPRLIPIFDRARVAVAVRAPSSHFWEAIWCAMRRPEIQQRNEADRKIADQIGRPALPGNIGDISPHPSNYDLILAGPPGAASVRPWTIKSLLSAMAARNPVR